MRWLRPFAVIMLVSMMSQAFGRLTFSVLLPNMVASYLGNYSAAGVSSAVNLAGYIVGICLSMALVRRVSSVQLMRAGLVLLVTSMALIAVVSSTVLLGIAQFVAGLGCAAGWLGCGSAADELAPPGRKGLAFGLMFAGVGVGITAIGAIDGLVRAVFGPSAWRPVWWCECVVGVIALVLVHICLRPMARPSPLRISTARPSSRQVLWLLALVSLGYALFGVAHASYTTFLTAALHEDRRFTVGTAATLYSLMGVSNIIGGTMFGRASDALGRWPLVVAGYALMVYSAATVRYGPNVLGGLSPICYGFVMSGLPTVVTAYVYGSVPPATARLAYGAITLAAGVGNLAGPVIGGHLADASGSFESTYNVAALTAISAAIATLVSLRIGRCPAGAASAPEPGESEHAAKDVIKINDKE